MPDKQLYHGGAPHKLGFAAMANGGGGSSDENFSVMYGRGGFISTGSVINPNTEDSPLVVSRCGHNVPECQLIGISALAVRFTSFFAGSTVTLHVRYNPADGSYSSQISSSTGTLIATLVITFPNTSGFFRYYSGNSDMTLGVPVPANSMVHVAVSSGSVNTITGLVSWLHFKKV